MFVGRGVNFAQPSGLCRVEELSAPRWLLPRRKVKRSLGLYIDASCASTVRLASAAAAAVRAGRERD